MYHIVKKYLYGNLTSPTRLYLLPSRSKLSIIKHCHSCIRYIKRNIYDAYGNQKARKNDNLRASD